MTLWLPAAPPTVPWVDEAAAAPVAVPALAPGGPAVVKVTPQVGVVCPAATSAGVRSPHEYAFCSAAVGANRTGHVVLDGVDAVLLERQSQTGVAERSAQSAAPA